MEAVAAALVQLVAVVLLENRAESVDAADRRAQIVRHRVAECLQLLIRQLELRVDRAQFLVAALSFADIANDGGEQHAGGIVPAGEREFDRKLAPVLVHRHELDVGERAGVFGGAVPKKRAAVPLAKPLGYEHGERFSREFSQLPSEEPFAAFVHISDQSAAVGRDDRVGDRFSNRAECPVHPLIAVSLYRTFDHQDYFLRFTAELQTSSRWYSREILTRNH